MFSLTLALLLACTPSALLDFAIPKWKADPAVRVEDTYKWIFQATRGGEHAAPDRQRAKQWLDGEWSSITGTSADQPLWEPLCPGGEIGRVNLRSYKDSGGREGDLLDAFITSSRDYRATVAKFTAAWNEFGRRLRKHSVGHVTLDDWTKLDAEMRSKDYPAVHHSEIYNKERVPAYRIVTKSEMRKLRTKLRKFGHR